MNAPAVHRLVNVSPTLSALYVPRSMLSGHVGEIVFGLIARARISVSVGFNFVHVGLDNV